MFKFFRRLFSKGNTEVPKEHHVAKKCDHVTKLEGKVEAFGRKTKTKMPLNKEGGVDWCLECLGKMAIQCAWCKNVIFIGDPVTLYSPEGAYVRQAHAVAHSEDPLQFVGCLEWGCADTGMDRAGFWLPGDDGKGFVHRVKTAYEITMEGNTDSIVIINDTRDIAEAQKPTTIIHA